MPITPLKSHIPSPEEGQEYVIVITPAQGQQKKLRLVEPDTANCYSSHQSIKSVHTPRTTWQHSHSQMLGRELITYQASRKWERYYLTKISLVHSWNMTVPIFPRDKENSQEQTFSKLLLCLWILVKGHLSENRIKAGTATLCHCSALTCHQ